jgi:hypothetical protein
VLTGANADAILRRLDEELTRLGEKRSLIVCGGCALIVMDITDRRTRDIDVIFPRIDPILKEVAKCVGIEFGLAENWLNDSPSSLARDLTKGWKSRTVSIFKGESLELRALGREDLLATKLYAFCDREDDFDDVVKLKPSKKELDSLLPWVLKRDGSALWPRRVQDCFLRLRKKLNHE